MYGGFFTVKRKVLLVSAVRISRFCLGFFGVTKFGKRGKYVAI